MLPPFPQLPPPAPNSQLLQRFLQSNPFWKRRRPGGSKPPTIPACVSRLPTPVAAAFSATAAAASSSSAAHRRRPPRSPAPSIASCIITSGNPAGRWLQERENGRGAGTGARRVTSRRTRRRPKPSPNLPPPILVGLKMTAATRQEVLGLYRRIFRLARKWQAASGQMEDTIKEKQYILNEARTLFQKNKNLMDPDLIKQCIDECTARIEIGLHYQIPYPRPIHLPPMGLTPLRGRRLQTQEKLRKLSKPVYLQSHDEIS